MKKYCFADGVDQQEFLHTSAEVQIDKTTL